MGIIRNFMNLTGSKEERTSLSSSGNTNRIDPEDMDNFLNIHAAQDEHGNYLYSFEEMLERTTNPKIRELICKLKSLSDQKKALAHEAALKKENEISAAVAQQILNRSLPARSGRSAAQRARSFQPRPSKLTQKGRLSYQPRKIEMITDEELDAVHQRFAASLPSLR